MTWNYRVMEFVSPPCSVDQDVYSWRAIHEVYYNDAGVQTAYSQNPVVIEWDVNEGDSAVLVMLDRMREALSKPVLTKQDFHFNAEQKDETDG